METNKQPKDQAQKGNCVLNALAALVHEPEVKEMIGKAELAAVHLVRPEHHMVSL